MLIEVFSNESVRLNDYNLNEVENFDIYENTVGNDIENFEQHERLSYDEELLLSDNEENDDVQSFLSSNASVNDNSSLRDELAELIVENFVSRNFVNKLLVLLNKYHRDLPTDYRALLQTPKKKDTVDVAGGEFIGFSIQDELRHILQGSNLSSITIDTNVDGVPVGQSSEFTFDVITSRVKELDYVFVAGVYCGPYKPNDVNAYLNPYIDELNLLHRENFLLGEKSISVNIGLFVLDAIARAPILNTKYPTGYYACHECYIQGEMLNLPARNPLSAKRSRKMSFHRIPCHARTDEEFRQKIQFTEHNPRDSHHGSRTHMAIEKLPIDIIKSFPFDYMHSALLGETRHILQVWSDTIKDFAKNLGEILIIFAKFVPSEFQRRCRERFDKWKATECRLFLVYLSFVSLKYTLPNFLFEHFLKFAIGIRILCSNKYSETLVDEAEQLIFDFISEYRANYPSEAVTYLLHGCSHLANSVRQHSKCLEEMSAFFAENNLQIIKKYYRNGRYPLQQIAKRIEERKLCASRKFVRRRSQQPKLSGMDSNGSFKKVECEKFIITNYPPNNVVFNEEMIVVVENIRLNNDGVIFVRGKAYFTSDLNNAFVSPIESKKIGIFSLNNDHTPHCIEIKLADVIGKTLFINVENFEEKTMINLLHW